MKFDRVTTPYDGKIYPPDWRAWRDPDIPDWIDPIGTLLDRHFSTPIENQPAVVADGETVTYRELARCIERYSGALAAAGLGPEMRFLLFGTDSLDYVVTWLAGIRRGAGRRFRSLQAERTPVFPH